MSATRDPIPLSAPDGKVYAYACPTCRRIADGGHWMGNVRRPDKREVAASRDSAIGCCTCRTCGRVERGCLVTCRACKDRQDAKWAAEAPKREAAYARERAAFEAALAKSADRDAAMRLCSLMRDISEDHYCAGWMMGLESALWGMLDGGPRRYGVGEVPESTIAELRRLHEKAGGWWVWQEGADGGERFVPTEEWKAMRR